MHHFRFLTSKRDFPAAASADAAALGLTRWLEAAEAADKADQLGTGLYEFAAQAADDPGGRRVLESIFGNSPFLTGLMIKDPEFTRGLFDAGPDETLTAILDGLRVRHENPASHEDLARALRIAKRQTALTVAIADVLDVWPLSRITRALSDFADLTLSLAAQQVLRDGAAKGAFTLRHDNDPEKDSGLVILAMGKLGARELNYSSDIDLIVLYDPERIETDNHDRLQNNFVRLTRNLARLMDERTTDGYVFRTDLRLRPDPGATPIALSVLGAETYYESLGQNWERAAMIKARPVAGDLQAGADFLKRLTPFIWRKSLDFAAIQDIHSIKRQIHAHKGGGEITVAGHNVKLGRGGIREIEFFAQTQQLIWGGRQPDLRSPDTCETLRALAAAGHCRSETAEDLIAAYEFLRRVEHRLQMINDEQTHLLPDKDEDLKALAVFLGYDGAKSFADELVGHLTRVRDHYGNLFDDSPTLGVAVEDHGAGNLVFTGGEPDPETIATLTRLGFEKPETVDAAVRGWHHGRYRAMRSARAREILTELMPTILSAIGATPAPDVAFLRFDEFLSRLPAGVQLFSMFQSNPQLLALVAEIMGKAPRLALHLSRRPAILDSVLTRDFFDPPPDRAALERECAEILSRADHFEQALDASRRWNNDRRFQIGVQLLRGAIDAAGAGRAFSAVAEAAIAVLHPVVEREFAENHGRVPGGDIAIVAFGKLGSREMTASSDLDLVFIYALADGNLETVSDGPRPLGAPQYYARLSQRLINALTALTAEGQLYEVDMRLRPSGTKGPIASSIDAFAQYHERSAWTWERMALTRARAIVGPKPLCARIDSIMKKTLQDVRDTEDLLRDAAHMRQRIDAERHTECLWSLKHLRGGIVDIEFITQYMALRHAHRNPDILGHDTRGTLKRLSDAGCLDPDAAQRLIDAFGLWQGLQGLLALTIEGDMTGEREGEISDALRQDLVRISGAPDFAALETEIRDTANGVYAIFKEMIEAPAAALPPPESETATEMDESTP